MPDLHYIAARMAFDNVDAQEIRDTVDALIDAGTHSDEFLAIIEASPPTLRDVLAPFQEYLEKLGIPIPDRNIAVWWIIHHHLSMIVAGTVNPFDGLKQLVVDTYWDYDFHKATRKYLGDSHGIERLLGCYDERDDMVEQPTEISCNGKYGEEGLRELDKEILECSTEWMARFEDRAFESANDPWPQG